MRHLGPGPMDRSETASAAVPAGVMVGGHFGARSVKRPLAGLATVAVVVLIIALAATLFRDGFTRTVPVTVISDRAGLVLNPEARVKMRGVQVGRVSEIRSRPDGSAELQLAIDPAQLPNIPDNVLVDITSTTVFGAKYVRFQPPPQPSAATLRAGQVLTGEQVTVETNTVFEQLRQILDRIDPPKVNAILSTLSRAMSGRGEVLGQTVTDLNTVLATLEPSLDNLRYEIRSAPAVLTAYADVATDMAAIADSAAAISRTIVDEQNHLDALLVGTIGFADLGQEVLNTNRRALTDVAHLLVPTTDLLNRYHEVLNCSLKGLIPLTSSPPLPVPGVYILAGLMPGRERYRYPRHLPKNNADINPEVCELLGLPELLPGEVPPFVVTDVGANPWEYGSPTITLNTDGLKQLLFGPIDGPPRNSAQIGMPG
ncbi:MCE family protein [Mycolicibacterium thermoresistibile]|uniref:Virulence factor Mce family protein n=2 Tax=Mycolicibacterium thermoresistibile TaxID=1797 RepID=G7CN10_MYCT3|nr:MCE family protein [Mycolicibacterium thermoresistibile]EHI10499.1 virulence factor Mce family protein [Mycolicibacterium thermoresistibile ATCC 19527]MCV7189638.1 MCE family protein [Mycolicibacterium thermoresistibile]GAT15449.1 virulence factor Mce family protein [Mycolicibacterium thermoresistibile]SNW17508.1 virulence factor Mce family protein [Mycolicibacterium thermoresistibile]